MVEKINGQGQYFREISPRIGVESREKYRLIWFSTNGNGYPDSSLIPEVLKRLSDFPEIDRNSFIVRNTYDNSNRSRYVLAVPIDCPGLLPQDDISEMGDLPEADETYLAYAWELDSKRLFEILVLAKNENSVGAIAISRARRMAHDESLDFDVEFNKLTREEFVEEAKRQIDNGWKLPGFMLRFAKLGEYQRMHLPGISDGGKQISA